MYEVSYIEDNEIFNIVNEIDSFEEAIECLKFYTRDEQMLIEYRMEDSYIGVFQTKSDNKSDKYVFTYFIRKMGS